MTGATLEAFFEHCPALLFIAAPDGSLLHRTGAMRERFAHRFDDAPTLAALFDDEDHATLSTLLTELAQGEAETERECIVRSAAADGTVLELCCTMCRGEDDLLHGHIEAKDHSKAQRARVERALMHTIMQTLDIALWAVDEHGVFTFHDGKALATAGLTPGQFLGMNLFEIFPPEISSFVANACKGESGHELNETHGVQWENWNIPLPQPNGKLGCAGITLDISERVATQRNLEEQLDTIRSQQRAIYELSAPVLNLWDSVLAVPLIGIMDSRRTDELTERLLEAAHRGHTRFVIVDLTGVEAVDTSIAAHVLRLLESLGLLGVEAMVTGVSPEVARTMVAVGIEFERVMTHRTLREGLAYCMRSIYGLSDPSSPTG